MLTFRAMLVALWAVLAAYTAVVVANHGLGLLPIFFGDMTALGWPGQFNLDFMGMLFLSALWVSWRHRFSGAGLALGMLAFFGGSAFLTVYLLILSFTHGSDVKSILLGQQRGLDRA